MNQYPFVTIFSITYNQRERVQKTIETMLAQNYSNDRFEIIILNDGSQDDSQALLTQIANNSSVSIKLLSCEHEKDYLSAKRWNQCIHAANPETEVFIQVDDVHLRPNFILQHLKWHNKSDNYLVTGAKFEAAEETWDLSTCRRAHLAQGTSTGKPISQYSAVWGASLSFTKKMIEKIYNPPFDIPYDEKMIGWGFQEVEFAYRMQQAGAILIYDPEAGVFHKNHEQYQELEQRGINRNETTQKDGKKNILYILKKHNLKELVRW